MIDLTELAIKLKNILNGVDSETTGIVNTIGDYYFNVQTYGEHLDSIVKNNKNTIPVYIGSVEGEIDPIPNIKYVSYEYKIYMYFPLSKKEDFFRLQDFISQVFVGKILNIGVQSKSALFNISIPEIEEIERLNFNQFQEWTENMFSLPVDTTELWCSLSFSLFASQYGDDKIILGNESSLSIDLNIDGVDYTYDLLWTGFETAFNADIASQQLIGEYQTSSVIKNSSTGHRLSFLIKKEDKYVKIIEKILNGEMAQVIGTLNIKINNFINISKKVLISDATLSINYGEPLSVVLTLTRTL